jgi:hypothetical protein
MHFGRAGTAPYRFRNGDDVEVVPTFPYTSPGVDLPVRPSRLRVWKDLEKLDPSGYPSGGVRHPSGNYNLLSPSFVKSTTEGTPALSSDGGEGAHLHCDLGPDRGWARCCGWSSTQPRSAVYAERLAVLPARGNSLAPPVSSDSESSLGGGTSDLRSSKSALVM